MAALKVAVVVMAVLILAGVTVIAVTIVRRVAEPAPTGIVQATLDEPAGSHIAGTSLSADRLAVDVQGGGPDRVVVLDLRSGHVVARAALAR